jgi:hypothetical protein
MLTHSVNESIVFAPSRLLQKEFVHHSGKRDGVMPADVRRQRVTNFANKETSCGEQ